MGYADSVTSFEDVIPQSSRFKAELDEDVQRENARKLLGIKLSDHDLDQGDEVPDISYVLRYQGLRSKIVEVHRSSKPIDINVGHSIDGINASEKTPVLEIDTLVSTQYVDDLPRGNWPPPPPIREDWGAPDNMPSNDVAQVKTTVIIIHSRHLINALRAVVGYYPGAVSLTADEVKIHEPYEVLVHHQSALSRYRGSQPSNHDAEYAATTANHIDILLEFLENTHGQKIREEEAKHQHSTPTTTFDYLWLLLRPGEVVYAMNDNVWSPFVVSQVARVKAAIRDRQCYRKILTMLAFAVRCWNYAYSNGRLRRQMRVFTINVFSGDEAIHNLPVIPARFFTGPNKDMLPLQVTAEQIRLGRMIWDLYKEPNFKSYDGHLAKRTHPDGDDLDHTQTGHLSGRVIVDAEGHEQYGYTGRWRRGSRERRRRYPSPPPRGNELDQLPYFAPRCSCGACSDAEHAEKSPFAAFQDLDPKVDEAPESDLYYHVISKVVPAFLLDSRSWGHVYAGGLSDNKFDKDAFKHLVLDEEIKLTVNAMIGKFANDGGHLSAWPKDFVKNKGQGRIFLLHGSPGVGKTCTAECVAELTQRPLLCLTSGDLGTFADDVGEKLEYFLELGERFGAMVLLDEADVYLESRRPRDIERNGLVSVFLRALEYYRGVLFLTTNQVQTFDPAFTSRIHVALHYSALTDADRERIWTSAFERLERDADGRIRVAVTAKEYVWGSSGVQSLRLNGREIRNALQTAVALAESEALENGTDGVLVTEKHFRSVTRMSRGFKSFMERRTFRDDETDDQDSDSLPGLNHDNKGRDKGGWW
ncbi:hypothetical protein GGS20DRAFT_599622 [Poronia punctata]|nr:hypothetical protein GGS20DRAFT_599622 [Poronia punctata]